MLYSTLFPKHLIRNEGKQPVLSTPAHTHSIFSGFIPKASRQVSFFAPDLKRDKTQQAQDCLSVSWGLQDMKLQAGVAVPRDLNVCVFTIQETT